MVPRLVLSGFVFALLLACVGLRTTEAKPFTEVVLSPMPNIPTWMQPDPPYKTRHGLCECHENVCGCCAQLYVQKLSFNQQTCLNTTYIPKDLAVSVSILLSNTSIFQATLSGRNPPPLCIPVPQFPAISICVRIHNLHVEGDNVYVCINLSMQLAAITLVDFAFDCLSFGPNGVTVVKPSTLMNGTETGFDLNLKQLFTTIRNSTSPKRVTGNNATIKLNEIIPSDEFTSTDDEFNNPSWTTEYFTTEDFDSTLTPTYEVELSKNAEEIKENMRSLRALGADIAPSFSRAWAKIWESYYR